MLNRETIINDLKRHEGSEKHGDRHVLYFDHLGYPTLGYGRLINERGGLTEEEAMYLLGNDITRVIAELDRRIPWWRDEAPLRQRALINMAFQLGVNGLMKFKKMLKAMDIGHYDRAYTEALDSRWAKQTPNRAMEVAKWLRDGYE